MVRKLELDSGVRTSYMYQAAYPLRLRREALEEGRSTRIPSFSIAGTSTEGLKTKVRAMIDGQTLVQAIVTNTTYFWACTGCMLLVVHHRTVHIDKMPATPRDHACSRRSSVSERGRGNKVCRQLRARSRLAAARREAFQ